MEPTNYEGYLAPDAEQRADEAAYDGFMRQDDFESFLGLLNEAARGVGRKYFHYPNAVDYSDEHELVTQLVYRERVYCYELYHKLRLAMERRKVFHTRMYLNAEVDKAGTKYAENIGRLKPDFVLHRPGEGAHNIAVVEVKAASAPLESVKEDFRKVKTFLQELNYFGGVSLIYGTDDNMEDIANACRQQFGTFWPPRFRLLWQPQPRQELKQLPIAVHA